MRAAGSIALLSLIHATACGRIGYLTRATDASVDGLLRMDADAFARSDAFTSGDVGRSDALVDARDMDRISLLDASDPSLDSSAVDAPRVEASLRDSRVSDAVPADTVLLDGTRPADVPVDASSDMPQDSLAVPDVAGPSRLRVLNAWRFGSSLGSETALGLAFDALRGNVWISGSYIGAADFGGGPLAAASGLPDAFVLKVGTDGTHRFSEGYNGPNLDSASAIVVDVMTGGVSVGGTYKGTTAFADGFTMASRAGSVDLFVTRLDVNGDQVFFSSLGGDGDEQFGAIAAGSNGATWIAGGFVGTFIGAADAGGGEFTVAGAHTDSIVAQLGEDGFVQSAVHLRGTQSNRVTSLARDSSNGMWFGGTFYGSLSIGSFTRSDTGGGDLFNGRFDGLADNPAVQATFGSTGIEDLVAVVSGGPSSVWLAGTFGASGVDFGGGLLASDGFTDSFLARRDSAGGFMTAWRFGSVNNDYASDVCVTPNGNVWVLGTFTNQTSLGGDPIDSNGDWDAYLVGFTETGAHVASIGLGGAGRDQYPRMQCSPDGTIWIAGSFDREVTLGGDVLTTSGPGDSDVVLIHVATE